jgi:hypothetical protein
MQCRTRIPLLFLLAFLALLPSYAFACSPAPQDVRVRCTIRTDAFFQPVCFGSDCSARFQREELGTKVVSQHLNDSIYINDRYGIIFSPLLTSQYADALTLIQMLCVEDMRAIRPAVLQAIDAWAKNDQRLLYNGDLVLEPYVAKTEQAMHQEQISYGRCNYHEYSRLGDWLLSKEVSRPYCVLSGRLGFPCPNVELSLVGFVWFLLQHIDFSTLPYLGIVLLSSLSLLGMIAFIHRHGGRRAFRPSIWLLALTLIGGVISTRIAGYVNFAIYLVLVYVTLCLMRALMRKNDN